MVNCLKQCGRQRVDENLRVFPLQPLLSSVRHSHKPGDIPHKQSDSPTGLPPRKSFFRRHLVLLALKTTSRFYRPMGLCRPISKHLIVKRGPFVDLHEAITMDFVASKTSVPVPRVHLTFVHKNMTYIVMERIKGRPIGAVFATLSEADLASVFAQLRCIMSELRALPPPSDSRIESCNGGSLYDSRIPSHATTRFGPFETIQQFHSFLRRGIRAQDLPENQEDRVNLEKMIVKQDGPWPPPVFTHGDLNPGNILVHGGRVTGIVDWEFGGWYPSYWEYTAAWCGNVTRTAWQNVVTEFLDPYPEELEMEITRQRWWGDL